jgi:hypothetical protein
VKSLLKVCFAWASLALAIGQFLPTTHSLAIDTDMRRSATWSWPVRDQIDVKLADYFKTRTEWNQPSIQVKALWDRFESQSRGPGLLDAVLATLAAADSRIELLMSSLDPTRSERNTSATVATATWIESELPSWIQSNIHLAIARALANEQLYDESLEQIELADMSEVVDPSTWLFYKAICHHHLLQRDDCMAAVTKLLEHESELVSRYAITAKLMKTDIEPMKEDSLDEISRLMKDVERRLVLGRTGTVVREQEKQIVEKLDKMIEKIEEQLQQQQQQQQQQAQQGQDGKGGKGGGQGKPMDESQIAGGSGPGDVDPKTLKDRNGWGDLPPAQRQEALQNITKDLPSHYREVIEAYFKRLATSDR